MFQVAPIELGRLFLWYISTKVQYSILLYVFPYSLHIIITNKCSLLHLFCQEFPLLLFRINLN